MVFSRYNYLKSSGKFGAFLFNTRTKFFVSLDEHVYTILESLSSGIDFNTESLNLSSDIIELFIRSKVFVEVTEDDDFYELKKFLRYKQAFSQSRLGLVLVPTFICNFNCPYCYEDNLPKYSINDEVIDAILAFIKTKGQKNIDLCWHGGEPLIAFDKIVSFLEKLSIYKDFNLCSHSMVTNGFLLDEHKCKVLNKYGLNRVQIALDGDKEYHDKSRTHKAGIPTYDTIMANIDNVFHYIPKCHVIIRVNLHSENKERFPNFYKELKKTFTNKNYSINIAFVNDLNNSCKVACLSEKGKIAYVRSLYESYDIKDINITVKPQIGGCTASCTNTYVIGPLGEIYKCWVDVGKKDRVVSNVFDGKLSNYIYSSYTVGSDMFSDERCKKCIFMPLCDGGCIIRRYNHKHFQMQYDPCPIDENDFLSLLELYYVKGLTND